MFCRTDFWGGIKKQNGLSIYWSWFNVGELVALRWEAVGSLLEKSAEARTGMSFFVGLTVSKERTAICILDTEPSKKNEITKYFEAQPFE